ncbi:MAG: hypothetical protein Q9196_002406 [Gyalolechia fulgens]
MPSESSPLQGDQAHVGEDTGNNKKPAEVSRSPSEGPSPLRIILILFTSVAGLGLLISFLSSDGLRGRWKIPGSPDSSLDRSFVERVNRILTENPLFDGHNDLAILIRYLYDNQIYDPAFTKPFEEGGLERHVDLPRLKAGKVGATFWSAFVLCPTNGTDFSDEAYVQYAALITNASGTTVAAGPYWGGVSEKGKILVKEMNRLGMLVDLSHVSKDTMMDVLGGRPEKWSGSRAPVLFSHSSAFALCPHPRNVPDDVLELVKTTNSVVLVNFSPDFISCVTSNSTTGLPELYPSNSTLHQVARHVRYIGDLIGYDHVGLGSDFDGISTTPKGLEDVSRFPDLVLELLKTGVSDDDAAKLVGRNMLRVWRDVEAVSSQMQDEGVMPAEDKLGKLFVQGENLDVDDLS